MNTDNKMRAGRNRTLLLTAEEKTVLHQQLIELPQEGRFSEPPNGTICGDCLTVVHKLPEDFVDLLILDPPYNLSKRFLGLSVKQAPVADYTK